MQTSISARSLVIALVPLGIASSACSPNTSAPSEAFNRGSSGQDARSQAPDGFWDHWGDGQAELNGYRLVQPRYGETRRGEAVLVFVTEEFTAKTRVKSDGGHGDEFPVLKLNETRDFQTGVYDYQTMNSAFVRLDGKDALGVPTKVAFSAQEWCGHVYDHLITFGDHYEREVHSYFDGEADRELEEKIPADAVFLDALPIYARGLAGTLVEDSKPIDVQLHPRLIDLRFQHRQARWIAGTVSVADGGTVDTPAGSFDVRTVTVQAGSDQWTYDVANDAPHTLVHWTGPDGEEAWLTGTLRSPYWNRHGEGQEALRQELGLGEPSWLRLHDGAGGADASTDPTED